MLRMATSSLIWFELLPCFALRCELVSDAPVARLARQQLCYDTSGRHVRRGDRALQIILRVTPSLSLATRLAKTDRFSLKAGIDLARRGPIGIPGKLKLKKRRLS